MVTKISDAKIQAAVNQIFVFYATRSHERVMASRYSKGVKAPFKFNKSEECPDMKVDGEYIVREIK